MSGGERGEKNLDSDLELDAEVENIFLSGGKNKKLFCERRTMESGHFHRQMGRKHETVGLVRTPAGLFSREKAHPAGRVQSD